MKLVYSPASPFVRKVSVVLRETGLLEQTELVEVTTTPVNSANEAIAANPTGKIPALVLEDGSSVYDSRVICRFLNDRAGANLYPQDDIWRHLTLEATADALMDAAVLMVYEYRVRPQERTYEPWVDAQWGKITRALKALDEDWIEVLSGDRSDRCGMRRRLSGLPPRRARLAF